MAFFLQESKNMNGIALKMKSTWIVEYYIPELEFTTTVNVDKKDIVKLERMGFTPVEVDFNIIRVDIDGDPTNNIEESQHVAKIDKIYRTI